MALTSANAETGQKGQIVPEILTGNGFRESLGKPVQSVPQPSIAALKLSKREVIAAADTFRDKAQEAHDDARKWQNRALLAESALATLRAAYEPASTPTRAAARNRKDNK